MKMNIAKVFSGIIIFSLLWSCSGSTYIVDSWKSPETTLKKGDLTKVMVAVLAPSETGRRRAEDQIVSYNDVFVPSYKVLGEKKTAIDTAASKQIIKNEGFDAVLTLRLKEKNNSQTWVPGSTTGYGYWGYHGMYYGSYYDPGYMREDVSYVVETTLFSLKDKQLLWSGITSSMNPTNVEQTIDEIVNEVYRRMQKDGLFEEPKTTKE